MPCPAGSAGVAGRELTDACRISGAESVNRIRSHYDRTIIKKALPIPPIGRAEWAEPSLFAERAGVKLNLSFTPALCLSVNRQVVTDVPVHIVHHAHVILEVISLLQCQGRERDLDRCPCPEQVLLGADDRSVLQRVGPIRELQVGDILNLQPQQCRCQVLLEA